MTGMVLKDVLVARKNITYYTAFLVIYGILSIAGVFPYSVLAGMVAMIGMLVPMASFSYDELARWDKFAVSTPAGRSGVVKGKFMVALLLTAVCTVFVGMILTAMSLLGVIETEAWWEPLAVVGVCSCVTLILNSLFLPFLFKYGAEKARIISLLIFASVFGSMALLALLLERGVTLPPIPDWVVLVAPVVLVVVTVVTVAVSFTVSLRIYGKKEL